MEIKGAEMLDVTAISRIHASSWKTAYKGMVPQEYLDNLKNDFWVPAFEKWMSEGTIAVKLVYDGKEPVGCVAYGKSRDAALPDWGEIVSLYVLPEYFGMGYGKALLVSAMEDLHQLGFKNIFLWVLEDNQRARKFYHRNGFHKTEDRLSCEISGEILFDDRFIHQQ